MEPLTSRRHPFVLRCRELAAERSAADGRVLLDGPRLLDEALAAGVTLEAAAIGPRLAGDRRLLERLETTGATLYQATDDVLASASPVRSPAGVVALARFQTADAGRVFPSDGLLVAAVGVQDPGNLGAIIRVADAAGAAGFVATAGSADPLGWKALRASAGGAFRLPLVYGLSPAGTVARARAAGMAVVATGPADGLPHHAIDLRGPLLLLLGGEGAGLTPEILAAADKRLCIPMRPPAESLNVAVAAGVILFEAARQREARA